MGGRDGGVDGPTPGASAQHIRHGGQGPADADPGPPRAPRRGGVPRYRRDHGGPHRWVRHAWRGAARPGWKDRKDGRYQNPASMDQLAATNWEYVRRRASGARPGEHWETLLQELVAEVKLGRVVGPTAPPAGWNIVTVPVLYAPGADRLVTPPPGRHFAAAFAIVQEDGEGNVKVRRGEDWRRSGHNATILAHDVPTHHFVDDVVDFIRRVVEPRCPGARLFGHDLLNAYRQWAVRNPAHSGTFLATPAGLTLWFHLAMCFRRRGVGMEF